jgi:hypothetical protein
VDPDPSRNRNVVRPPRAGQRDLRVTGGGDGVRRTRAGVQLERVRMTLAPETLEQPRGALDVGERQRHRPGRLSCHAANYRASTDA